MCKLGMYTTKMFSVLVAVGTVVSCPTYAADRAVIEVRGDSKAEVMWFRSGAVLFTDRGYRLTDFPAALGWIEFRIFGYFPIVLEKFCLSLVLLYWVIQAK